MMLMSQYSQLLHLKGQETGTPASSSIKAGGAGRFGVTLST